MSLEVIHSLASLGIVQWVQCSSGLELEHLKEGHNLEVEHPEKHRNPEEHLNRLEEHHKHLEEEHHNHLEEELHNHLEEEHHNLGVERHRPNQLVQQ